MASQSTTAVQGPSSASSTPVPPAQISSATSAPSSAATSPSPSTTSQQTSASASASLSSASQVAPASNSTSQSLPSTATLSSSQSTPSLVGNGVSNTPGSEADQPISPMKIIIPAISAVVGISLIFFFYRQYRRKRQLKEVPLPAKRTPVILERRPAQSISRFETPRSNNEYDSLIAPITSSPYHLGTASYFPFPSKSTNTFDGPYPHPSLTPSASMTPSSASVLSLERQPSMVSLPTPLYEPVKGTSANNLPTLTADYPSNSPPQFLQQPFTPPHVRRDLRPVVPRSRAVSMMSVASRHSTYSLAAMRSGQHPGSGGTLRGPPHKNNMNIVLPQPLGPNSRPNSTYYMQHGESPPVHLQHIGSKGGISHPVQGLWNGDGEIQHQSNASKDNIHEGKRTHTVTSLGLIKSDKKISIERQEGNSGNQGPSPSSVTMSPVTMSHRGMSHAQSAPAAVFHGLSPLGLPDYDVPPVPPLPPLSQMSHVDPRAAGTSNQNPLAFLTHATSLAQSRQPSPPRSPLRKQLSIAEDTPEPGIAVHTGAETETMGQIPQLEEPMQQTRLLPDSVFIDPDEELENATIESRSTSASFTPAYPHPIP
jgi:hypothetical protein